MSTPDQATIERVARAMSAKLGYEWGHRNNLLQPQDFRVMAEAAIKAVQEPKQRALWDVEAGRALYDQGLTPKAIADKLGATTNAVAGWAYRHWPPREVDLQRRANRPKQRAAAE